MAIQRKSKNAWHHGDLRRAVLDASLQVIEKQGVSALSLRKVAEKANVSAGAPYHHFEDRQALLFALAEEGFARMRAAMEKELAATSPEPIARLEALGRTYIDFALSEPGYFRVMFNADLDKGKYAGLDAECAQAFSLFEEVLSACQGQGFAADQDAASLALAFWSGMHGAACLWVDGPLRFDFRGYQRELLSKTVPETLVHMLAATSSKARR